MNQNTTTTIKLYEEDELLTVRATPNGDTAEDALISIEYQPHKMASMRFELPYEHALQLIEALRHATR